MIEAVLCVNNQCYKASLEVGKRYDTEANYRTYTLGMVRVIDESGSDYLYPTVHFAMCCN
jgi:hypothetical protein